MSVERDFEYYLEQYTYCVRSHQKVLDNHRDLIEKARYHRLFTTNIKHHREQAHWCLNRAAFWRKAAEAWLPVIRGNKQKLKELLEESYFVGASDAA